MKISGPLRDGAPRQHTASHWSGLLVYRALGGG